MISTPHGEAQPGRTPPTTLTLAELRPGQEGEVAQVRGDEAVRARLMELGFIAGERVRIIRRAPLGCPLEVDLDGSRFSIRLETARAVHLRNHG